MKLGRGRGGGRKSQNEPERKLPSSHRIYREWEEKTEWLREKDSRRKLWENVKVP